MSEKSEVKAPAIRNPEALLKLLERFKDFQDMLEKQPLSPHTKRAYETRLQHCLGFLGSRLDEYPNALTSIHTRNYVVRDYR